jgi:dihydroorotase
MNVLIKSATIIDPKSDFNNKTQDVLVEKGRISKIADRINNTKNFKEIKLEDLHISQGWFDCSVSFGEPGFEERETILNGLKTAALSGYTAVAVNANTDPVISTSSDVTFLKSKAEHSPVELLPIGTLTKDGNGTALAELFDMRNSGAVAFGDYQKSIGNSNLMKIALQYASRLGLKGIAPLAEEIQIARDLYLLEYTGGKLHIPTISTAGSVQLIREAKAKNLDISCSVAVHNLIFSDDQLSTFNTNFKVSPPLRTPEDIEALRNGLKDGTIDMVTSDHNPLDIEHKKLEFDRASYGTVGLESAFGALHTIFPLKSVIKFLTRGKERFGLKHITIDVGNPLNVTLFNPKSKYTFSSSNLISKSKNTIFENYKLKGESYGIICNNKIELKH